MTHCELCVSGIYPKIFSRIDSLFKAGEGTLGFLTKTPTCTRICRALRDVRSLRRKRRMERAAFQLARSIFRLSLLVSARDILVLFGGSFLVVRRFSVNRSSIHTSMAGK